MQYRLMLDQKYIKITQNKLSEIDRYTTEFNDIKSLLDDISKKINEKLIGYGNLKISYAIGEKKYDLDVAYSDKNKLNDLEMVPLKSGKPSSKINHNNSVFKNTMEKYIKLFKSDIQFYQYIMKNESNLKVKEVVEDIKNNDTMFNRNRLNKCLDSYSSFRKLLFMMEAYENNKKIKNKSSVTTYQNKKNSQKINPTPRFFNSMKSSDYLKDEEEQIDEYGFEESDCEEKYR